MFLPLAPYERLRSLELIVTVAIVSILASAALPLTQIARQRMKEQELRTALRQIREAIDAYKQTAEEGRVARAADASGYPPSLDALVIGVDDAKLPVKKSIYYLRSLPRDPFAPEDVPAAETWARRSYEARPTTRVKARTCSTCTRKPRAGG